MIPEGKTRVMVTFDDEFLEKVDDWCDRYGVTRSEFFRYVGEVAFSADTTVPDVLRKTFVKQAIKLAADKEIADRLARLKDIDVMAASIAGLI